MVDHRSYCEQYDLEPSGSCDFRYGRLSRLSFCLLFRVARKLVEFVFFFEWMFTSSLPSLTGVVKNSAIVHSDSHLFQRNSSLPKDEVINWMQAC